jgi:hypothetical protein
MGFNSAFKEIRVRCWSSNYQEFYAIFHIEREREREKLKVSFWHVT